MRKNYERRQHLASMLLPDDPEKGRSVLMVDFVVAVVVFTQIVIGALCPLQSSL